MSVLILKVELHFKLPFVDLLIKTIYFNILFLEPATFIECLIMH